VFDDRDSRDTLACTELAIVQRLWQKPEATDMCLYIITRSE